MHNFAKLSEESRTFLAGIPAKNLPNPDILAMAVARAVSARMSLPTMSPQSVDICYLETCMTQAKEDISQLCELTTFDTTRALELTKTLWLVRYKAAFPSEKLFATLNVGTESDFLGYGTVVAAPDIEFIRANSLNLCMLYNGLAEVLRDTVGLTEANAAAAV